MRYKRCPYCDEKIRSNAIKCRYCGSVLTDTPPSPITPSTETYTMAFLTGALANKYEILEEIGKGGMASVYKAVQKSLNRIVALKVIHQSYTYDAEFLSRFYKEAEVSAHLKHNNIINIYEIDKQSPVKYMALEYLDGDDLHKIIKERKKLSIQKTIDIIVQIAEALDYAHNKGIIHRDVKASNIIITKEGRPVLMDFGIAHAVSGTKLTQTGVVIGTPEYMSPEQALGKTIDKRSDIYSLGVVMYECLTGRVPFKGDTPIITIHQIINEHVTSPSNINSDIPKWLEDILLKTLEKDPENRIQSGKALAESLKAQKEVKIRTRIAGKKKVIIALSLIITILIISGIVLIIKDFSKKPSNTETEKQTITSSPILLKTDSLQAEKISSDSIKKTITDTSKTVKTDVKAENTDSIRQAEELRTLIEKADNFFKNKNYDEALSYYNKAKRIPFVSTSDNAYIQERIKTCQAEINKKKQEDLKNIILSDLKFIANENNSENDVEKRRLLLKTRFASDTKIIANNIERPLSDFLNRLSIDYPKNIIIQDIKFNGKNLVTKLVVIQEY